MGPKVGDFKASIYSRSSLLIKSKLTKIQAIVTEFSNQPEPLTAVQLKQLAGYTNEIRKKKHEFENNLQRALLLEGDEAISDTTLSADQDEIESLFSVISATIEVLIPPEAPKTPSAISDVSVSVGASHTNVRLPQLELPKFSGEPLKWTSFQNMFDSTVNRNASLSSVMKFQYLLSTLSGEPLNLIKSLALTAPNYLIAWDLLRERYHNSRRLQSLHLNQILDLPNITAISPKGLRQFINCYTENTQALTALDCDVSNDNPLLSALLLRKMDTELRKKLESFRSNTAETNHTLPTAEEIMKFLNTETSQIEDANLHNTFQSHKSTTSSSHAHKLDTRRKVQFRSNDVSLVTAQANSPNSTQNKLKPASQQCFVCNSTAHKVYACDVFKNKTPHERFQLVKKMNRCISCLGSHELKMCQSHSNCRTCNKRHHTALHFSTAHTQNNSHTSSDNQPHRDTTKLPSGDTNEQSSLTSVTLTSNAQSHAPCSTSTVLLGTTLVKLTSPKGNTHVFRALIDSASQCDLITERVAQILNAKRVKSNIHLTGLSQNAAKIKGQTYLHIESLSGALIFPHNPMLILDNITVDLPRVPISLEVFKRTQQYILADPTFHMPGRIDVVLGCALFPKLLTNEHYSLGCHMPDVLGTKLGYVLMGHAPVAADNARTTSAPHTRDTTASCLALTPGPHPSTASPALYNAELASHLSVALHVTSDADLSSSIQRFWVQETMPTSTQKEEEEERCDKDFIATHSRDSNGRYIVRLPFKDSYPPLGNSKPAAETRFYSLERKFRAQLQFSSLYHDFMAEYLALDHMTKAENVDLSMPHYYLPHHGVLKENSSTTKLRTVFDGSAKTSTGTSLNDILFTGRKLQTNICDVLTQFRCHTIVISCDIRHMYRQILIHPDDRNYQLILWRDNPTQPLDTFKLGTVTYGLNSSPYLAIKTLHQLAKDEGSLFPAAAEVLKNNTYIDDIISGRDTEEDALELQSQLIQLLKRGGFELRKWVSNSPRILQDLPAEHLETPVFLQHTQQPHFAILGLHWSPDTDCFSYNLNLPMDTRPTKRSVLSLIAQIYDPCGFLAPCIMLAKCFMQFLWTTGLSWDEPLPSDSAEKWQNFITETQHLSHISIPRAFQLSGACATELHGFADASESGYAAVVYFRCQLQTGEIVVRPILAKTRVAPLKRVTLPRLELCAAHLLAQLVAHCLSLFKDKITAKQIYLWSDSSVVLTWVRMPPYKLKTYVANRVSEIQTLVPVEAWRHICSSSNPADCASRGISAPQLVDHPLWWTGPSWFTLPHHDWPAAQFIPADISSSEETKKTPLVVLTATPVQEWDVLSRYSSWDKLQRVVALVLRFVRKCKKIQRYKGPITPAEIFQARRRIFKLVQHTAFAEELTDFRKQRPCSTRLQRLKPFLDADGLLRVGGRLSNSLLPQTSQHPVLLPKQHPVVDLIVDHCHLVHLHAGPQLTQALLAQSVWILSARSVVRSRIFKCVTCFRHKPRNSVPVMGDLPPARVTPSRPFLSTGTDYCGPFAVKTVNLRSVKHLKMYLCIFVCMATKAVHIEVVTDLTTDGFIAALTRFVSRRGLCSDIYSDCGTNFIGADASLRRLLESQLNSASAQDHIGNFATPRGIKFHFNSPAAPHMGGLWESAVKSAKHHLKRVMGETVLTLPEFITLTTQVEAMLNSRPLTPLSNDPSDLTALTPGHFLIGTPLASVPEPPVREVPINRLRHWRVVQKFHQDIWKRWSVEYLHTLQQRSKWTIDRANLKVGDLVLVHADTPPLSWPLARITALHPGRDGIVRTVDIKTATGQLTRPVVKLFPLPLD